MPRYGIRKKARQYVLERFKEEDPESYFKYRAQSSRGLSQEQMEFLEALSHKNVNIIKSFLNRGLDPNFTILPNGVTPLHMAILEHKENDAATEKILRALLFFGCDPNAQDHWGYSPLHTACFARSYASAELLIQAGADVNCPNWNQETLLMYACSLKEPCPALVKLLVNNGAEVEVTNVDSQNVLHLLCSSDLCRSCDFDGRAKVAQFLLEQGLPSNIVDIYDKTPLCYELLRLVYFFSTSHSSLDEPPAMSDAIKVAIALVEGGGLSNFEDHKDHLMTFINTLSSFPQARSLLTSFFLTVRCVIPLVHFNQICSWVVHPGGLGEMPSLGERAAVLQEGDRLEDAASDNTVGGSIHNSDGVLDDIVWTTPPSLLALSKTVVRHRLGGRVLHTASLLSLPTKMEAYIKSLQ